MFIPGISPINGYDWIGNLAQNTATAPNGLDASVSKPASTGSSQGAQDAAALIPTPDFTVSLGSLTSAASNLQAADNSNILQNNPPVAVAQPVLNPGSSPTLEAFSPTLINGVLQANENLAQALFGKTNLEALLLLIPTLAPVPAPTLAPTPAPILAPPPAPTPPPTLALTSALTSAPTPAFTVPQVSPTLEALSPDLINLQAVESNGVLQVNENLAQALFGVTNREPLLSTPSNVQAVLPANATELNPARSQYFFTAYFKVMNMPISSFAVDITA